MVLLVPPMHRGDMGAVPHTHTRHPVVAGQHDRQMDSLCDVRGILHGDLGGIWQASHSV